MKSASPVLLVTLAFTHHLYAGWAAHLVITPKTLTEGKSDDSHQETAARLAKNVSVETTGENQVKISFKVGENEHRDGKRYYLVTAKDRIPEDKLNLRSQLIPTFRLRTSKEPEYDEFETVEPLEPKEVGESATIEVILAPELAMRSYIVWEFSVIVEDRGFVMDGGFWLTYDLPAFVEAAEESGYDKSP